MQPNKERTCENCRNHFERDCILRQENLTLAEDANLSPSETCRLNGLSHWQQKFFEYESFSEERKGGCVTLRVPKGLTLDAATLLLHPDDVELLRWLGKNWRKPKQADVENKTVYTWEINGWEINGTPANIWLQKRRR
jgi:hypothetical protein